jgi:hypothetical protein
MLNASMLLVLTTKVLGLLFANHQTWVMYTFYLAGTLVEEA